MKITISFRFSGENLETMRSDIRRIEQILRQRGHDTYCTIWHENEFKEKSLTNRQIMDGLLTEIDNADSHLCYIRSAEKSGGMLLEAGYAYARNKPLIVAVPRNAKTIFLRELATHLLEYETFEDLLDRLQKTHLSKIPRVLAVSALHSLFR